MVVERAGKSSGAAAVSELSALEKLVAAKPKLHRALFWQDVERERGERPVVRHWHVHLDNPLWSPEIFDFPWLYGELASRPGDEDRRIMLSLIVAKLRAAESLERDSPNLRTLIAGSTLLNQDLDSYLAPPPPENEASRALRERREAIRRAEEVQEARGKQSWITFRTELQTFPSKLFDPQELLPWPGAAHQLLTLTNWLQRKTGQDDPEKAALSWRSLRDGFGAAVAEAYRDGMVALWRLVEPERPKHRGHKVSIKWTTILSLAGLRIEAAEDSAWASGLTSPEALRAARHGCHSEHNFPDWIEALMSAHPDAVRAEIGKALKREWSSTNRPTLFLSRYAYQAEPASHDLRLLLHEAVSRREAASLHAADLGLRVLASLEIDEAHRAKLSTLAAKRFRRHIARQAPERALRALAFLFVVDASRGAPLFCNWLSGADPDYRQGLAEEAFRTLFGRDGLVTEHALARAGASVLEQLVLLCYQQIKPDEDNVHDGPYSSDRRDEAESARNALLNSLIAMPGAAAYRALQRLSDHPDLCASAHRLRELARGKAERDGEVTAWSIADVLGFEREHTMPARTGEELLRIAIAVLDEIAFDLQKQDASSRRVLAAASDEEAIQNWLAEQLMLRSRDRFHVHRETEVAEGKLPDIVLASTASEVQLAIEVKRGDSWTVKQLEQALRKQLAETYLKPETRRHGLLVVTHNGCKGWRRTGPSRGNMNFAEVIAHLSSVASSVLKNTAGPIQVAAKGLDASDQSSS